LEAVLTFVVVFYVVALAVMVMEDGPSTSNREDSIANRNGPCDRRVTMRRGLRLNRVHINK
jgi:hypothetical protein